jgi:hypothetical protein
MVVYSSYFITGDPVLLEFDNIPSKQERPLRALYPLKGIQTQGAFKTQSVRIVEAKPKSID